MELASNWKELSERAYQNASKHGFYNGTETDNHYLCLVISELMEIVEADRRGDRADVEMFKKKTDRFIPASFTEVFKKYIKDSLEDELADAAIRLYSLVGKKRLMLGYNEQIVWMLRFGKEKPLTDNIYTIVGCLTHPEARLEDRVEVALKLIYEMAAFQDIDLEYFIDLKMKFNASREMLHGKKY